jgi:O-antigen ligase
MKNKLFESLLAIGCFSVFTSKSGLSAGLPLLIIVSLWIITTEARHILKNRFIVAVGSLYFLTIFSNFFSLGGVQSVQKVTLHWFYPLLVLPGALVIEKPKWQKLALISSGLGLMIGSLYTLYQFGSKLDFYFDGAARLGGFWDISRWGVFTGFAVLSILALVLHNTFLSPKSALKKELLLNLILLLLVEAGFVLSNSRAPFMALGIAVVVFCILKPKLIYWVTFIGLISALVLASNKGFQNRISSIMDVKKSPNGILTSNNESNEGRLHMWQVALQFFKEQPVFGVGFRNTERPLREYLDKNPELKEKYVTSEFSFNDQHSSYLQILVEQGLIFFVVFWGVIGWGFGRSVFSWWQTRSIWDSYLIALYIYHGIIFIFYTSITSYEMSVFFPFIALAGKLQDKPKAFQER